MTRARWFTLVLAVAIVTIVWLLLPPAGERLAPPPDPLTAPWRDSRAYGALRTAPVRRSRWPLPLIAPDSTSSCSPTTATRRARTDPPRYVDGVLLIDAVEISTDDGHLVALGIPQAPYRLAGEARDVIEDVHRLGGFAIAAHPDSPKPELQWRDWKAAIDGLEWLNVDSDGAMSRGWPYLERC
jgi:hypothetical protein